MTLVLSKDRTKQFIEALPRFIFHSTTLDRIPNEVNLTSFIKDPQGTSKAMANLCLAAGLSMQTIQELANSTDIYLKQLHEDHYKGTISGGLNEYWTQVAYEVHFRFDTDKLSVAISDENYGRRIPPSDRSDGFQWYLSFYGTVWNAVGGSAPTILLLDNPGLELHADGQREIKRLLEERLPAVTPIIYVTHSPAMIDPFHLEQLRQVDLLPHDKGTVVSPLKIKHGDEFDLLEPVRSAVGASLVSSLMFGQFNILVEGAADKPILEGSFELFYKKEKDKFLLNGSISESKGAVLPNLYKRANLPFIIYLDADHAGHRLAKALVTDGIHPEKIVVLNSVIQLEGSTGVDFELEDILSADFYHSAVLQTYTEQPVDIPEEGNQKRTKKYEAIYKQKYDVGFNKRRVADTIKRLLLTGKADEQSLTNLKKLTSELYEGLKKQVSANGKQSVGSA
jgi:hypothetical protein